MQTSTNHPNASFIDVSENNDFPIQNLPYGIFTDKASPVPRVGVAIGDMILDLAVLEKKGILTTTSNLSVFNQPSLNALMVLEKSELKKIRHDITELLSKETPTIRDNAALRDACLIPQTDATMHMPVEIGDYTDFYSSEDHARNVGAMFRDKDNPLLPNWKQMPVAYNGRASSVVISGTNVKRPYGQIKTPTDSTPIYSASKKLDFELEMGFFIGQGNTLSQPIPIQQAEQHIFGFVLVNDWSARDIQQWEGQPLGPFLSKIFGTSISPWVITAEALEPFKRAMPTQNPTPLEYLQHDDRYTYDIELEVALRSAKTNQALTICHTHYKHMYWSVTQQLAHHTVTGCNMRPGDLLASGTISGPSPDSYGCLLELTQNGKKPFTLPNGDARTFLEDGDEVIMTAWCQGQGFRIGFGELRGAIESS